jgi:hypothetical protein
MTNKIAPMGFDTAAAVLTMSLSDEAKQNLIALVKDVAEKHGHHEGQALRVLRLRIQRAGWTVRQDERRTIVPKRNGDWAREVWANISQPRSLYATA